jgi:hypothetical protein
VFVWLAFRWLLRSDPGAKDRPSSARDGPVLALALAAQEGAAAQTGWRHVRTGVAELLTDADADTARRAAARLERFAQVLRAVAPVTPTDTQGALVLAVADEGLFASLRPRRGGRAFEVDGFVQGGAARTIVAVSLAAQRPDALETLDHEYVHLALNGALPAQPLWLAEGLAELFSAWSEGEGGVSVGLPRPAHVRLLRSAACSRWSGCWPRATPRRSSWKPTRDPFSTRSPGR